MNGIEELISHYIDKSAALHDAVQITSVASAIHAEFSEYDFEAIEDILLRRVILLQADACWCGCNICGSEGHN